MKKLIIAVLSLTVLFSGLNFYLFAFNKGRAAGILSVESKLAERRTDLEGIKIATEQCQAWKQKYNEMEELITIYFDIEDEIRKIKR